MLPARTGGSPVPPPPPDMENRGAASVDDRSSGDPATARLLCTQEEYTARPHRHLHTNVHSGSVRNNRWNRLRGACPRGWAVRRMEHWAATERRARLPRDVREPGRHSARHKRPAAETRATRPLLSKHPGQADRQQQRADQGLLQAAAGVGAERGDSQRGWEFFCLR